LSTSERAETNDKRDGEAVSHHVGHEHGQETAAAGEVAAHEALPAAGEPTGQDSVELTGHDTVDEVLGSLEGLEGRQVAEHVEVFEAAHEALRAALAEAGNRSGGTTS
jgi:hypothetical protein